MAILRTKLEVLICMTLVLASTTFLWQGTSQAQGISRELIDRGSIGVAKAWPGYPYPKATANLDFWVYYVPSTNTFQIDVYFAAVIYSPTDTTVGAEVYGVSLSARSNCYPWYVISGSASIVKTGPGSTGAWGLFEGGSVGQTVYFEVWYSPITPSDPNDLAQDSVVLRTSGGGGGGGGGGPSYPI
ncbi:MAG: hypothetical protein ACFFB3_10030 [Candidatus Hodarchaeota archaeon]